MQQPGELCTNTAKPTETQCGSRVSWREPVDPKHFQTEHNQIPDLTIPQLGRCLSLGSVRLVGLELA